MPRKRRASKVCVRNVQGARDVLSGKWCSRLVLAVLWMHMIEAWARAWVGNKQHGLQGNTGGTTCYYQIYLKSWGRRALSRRKFSPCFTFRRKLLKIGRSDKHQKFLEMSIMIPQRVPIEWIGQFYLWARDNNVSTPKFPLYSLSMSQWSRHMTSSYVDDIYLIIRNKSYGLSIISIFGRCHRTRDVPVSWASDTIRRLISERSFRWGLQAGSTTRGWRHAALEHIWLAEHWDICCERETIGVGCARCTGYARANDVEPRERIIKSKRE